MGCVVLPTFSNNRFEVDGIYYRYLNKSAKTVEVISSKDTSVVTIPSSVTYNDTTYSVTSIGHSAFADCTGLTEVTIPNSVTEIGTCAFYRCTGLTEVNIPNSVTEIGTYAFHFTGWYNNQADGILYLDNCCLGYKGEKPIGTLSLKEGTRLIGWEAFGSCEGLISVTIPNSVVSIGYFAFSCCSGLTSITIPNSVSSIGSYAFEFCHGLTEVTIPNSVTKIGDEAFIGCSGLTSITISNSVTSIGSKAFHNTGWYNNQADGILYLDNCCLGYKGEKPIGALLFKDGTRLIGSSAFIACSGLTSITIPNSVASIGNTAFYCCTDITSVVIGKSIETIGERTFEGMENLEKIISLSPTPPTCENKELFSRESYSKATLYVPKDSFAKYFINEVWGEFLDVKKIESLVSLIKLNNTTIELERDSTTTLSATVSPSDATIKDVLWESSNPQVAMVDQSGKVTALTLGTAIITATAVDGSEISAYCNIIVKGIEPKITLSQTEVKLPVNDIMTLTYTVAPSNTPVEWSTSNPDVAYLKKNSDGSVIVVGMSEGEAIITATATATDGTSSSASCKVIVGIDGVEGIEADNNAIETARYDIHGRLLNEPTRGINIVIYSDGSTKKEIVK